MTRKAVKDLDSELHSLRKEFQELTANFGTLFEKYENLEKKCEIYQCKICEEGFASKREFMKHKKCHMSVLPGKSKCDDCDKTVNEQWKLNAHVKIHKKFPCEKCEKVFEVKDIKEKHVKIAHEGWKIFCTFYNNDEDCPHEDKCIFLHEDSPICRFGKGCERNNCMFKHTKDSSENEYDNKDEGKDDIEDENKNDSDENEDDEDDSGDDEVDDNVIDIDNDDVKEDENKADGEKESEEEMKIEKCDFCQFESADKKRFSRHKFENHSTKGKYVCMGCKVEFDTRTQFNNHKYFGCSPT